MSRRGKLAGGGGCVGSRRVVLALAPMRVGVFIAGMISVEEAERLVMSSVGRLPAERCALKEAHGRVLRQAVKADRDGPPFDRATLDGVCIRFEEWFAGRREFPIAGLQAAGAAPVGAPPEGSCLEIMTGAPIPAPCDCVLRVEDFERRGDVVRAKAGATLERDVGVHARGSDFRDGDVLLQPGRRLTGREIAVAASCGCVEVQVTVSPRIAVLTTGDELVEIDDVPKPHQIRRSNDLAMRATLIALGFDHVELNHLPDNPQAISWNLERLLQQADVIIITGGVSQGKFDHVPDVLKELGVVVRFHGVAQRPGKPMWFGTKDRDGDFLHPEDTRVVAVFALPGNPVSAFTCLHRYALPGLDLMMTGTEANARKEFAALAAPARANKALTQFIPVSFESAGDGRWRAVPRPSNTSGDFASVAMTDGFVELPPCEGADVTTGSIARAFRWR